MVAYGSPHCPFIDGSVKPCLLFSCSFIVHLLYFFLKEQKQPWIRIRRRGDKNFGCIRWPEKLTFIPLIRTIAWDYFLFAMELFCIREPRFFFSVDNLPYSHVRWVPVLNNRNIIHFLMRLKANISNLIRLGIIQCFGSVFICCWSGSSILGWIPIRIRI